MGAAVVAPRDEKHARDSDAMTRHDTSNNDDDDDDDDDSCIRKRTIARSKHERREKRMTRHGAGKLSNTRHDAAAVQGGEVLASALTMLWCNVV